jgi:hypothetical protein
LDHPELFKNYPELKGVGVRTTSEKAKNTASYNPLTKQIDIGNHSDNSVLFHEIQHAIQENEGFARGGSPANPFVIDKDVAPNFLGASEKYTSLVKTEEGKKILKEAQDYAEAKSTDKMFELANTSGSPFLWKGKTKDELYMNYFEEFMRSTSHPVAEAFRQMKNFEYEIPSPMQYYKRLAGEIESRDVAARLRLTTEERFNSTPYSSEGIPLSDWIVRHK